MSWPDQYLDGCVLLYPGECLEVLRGLEADNYDSCVTDPPYHLQSIHKRFAAKGRDETSERYAAGPYGRTAKGFMGKQWDGGDIAFQPELWVEILRVLKPGAHLVAFGGTRTYHRMACAIEDAGFEIRDMISWIYGSGFPKSHDVSKGIDKSAGAERKIISEGSPIKRMIPGADQNKAGWEKNSGREFIPTETAPATEAAKQWEGWGTALKPALEPIVLARKPLSEKTVAANVLKHGTGAINIDGCRVGMERITTHSRGNNGAFPKRPGERTVEESGRPVDQRDVDFSPRTGRWPANIIHDGSEEVLAGFPESVSTIDKTAHAGRLGTSTFAGSSQVERVQRGDSGSAARFFYTAKADKNDRIGSKHPTVKPLDLMQYLVRLVTQPGGVVLDPFAGTGTTGEAAWREGMRAVLIEREKEYQRDIERRMKLANKGPAARRAASIEQEKHHGLPLFRDRS